MAQRKRARRRPYRVFRLTSWEAFLKLIIQPPYSNWAFRGERDERWPLYSSLSRYLQNFGVRPGRLAGAGGAHPARLQTQGPPVSGRSRPTPTTISSGWR